MASKMSSSLFFGLGVNRAHSTLNWPAESKLSRLMSPQLSP